MKWKHLSPLGIGKPVGFGRRGRFGSFLAVKSSAFWLFRFQKLTELYIVSVNLVIYLCVLLKPIRVARFSFCLSFGSMKAGLGGEHESSLLDEAERTHRRATADSMLWGRVALINSSRFWNYSYRSQQRGGKLLGVLANTHVMKPEGRLTSSCSRWRGV